MDSRVRRAAAHPVAVPVTTIAANVLVYGLLLLAARTLDRAVYGETVVLLNLVLIGTIPSLAIQTVAARRAATATSLQGMTRVTALIGIAGAAVVAISAPILAIFLHLGSVLGLLAVAAAIPSLTMLGLSQGVSQGREAWGRMSAVIALMAAGRAGGGIAGLLVTKSSGGTALGLAVGVAIAAFWALRLAPKTSGRNAEDETISDIGFFREAVHAAHAHGAFLVLTSLDLFLARHLLSPDAAGLYAAGSVLSRAALWLPQPVTAVLFARMSDPAQHRRALKTATAFVTASAAAMVLGSLVFGGLVAAVIGGAKYAELAVLCWMFALAGASLAAVQLGVMAGLAVLRRRRLLLVWACAAVEVVGALLLGDSATPERLILLVALLTAGTALASLAIAFGYRTPAPEPVS